MRGGAGWYVEVGACCRHADVMGWVGDVIVQLQDTAGSSVMEKVAVYHRANKEVGDQGGGWGLGAGGWGLGFWVRGLGFGVLGLGFRPCGG